MVLSGLPPPQAGIGARVLVSVRPEQLRLSRESGPDRIRGRLHAAMPLGPVILFDIEAVGHTPLKLSATREEAAHCGDPSPGDEIQVALAASDSCVVFAQVAICSARPS